MRGVDDANEKSDVGIAEEARPEPALEARSEDSMLLPLEPPPPPKAACCSDAMGRVW